MAKLAGGICLGDLCAEPVSRSLSQVFDCCCQGGGHHLGPAKENWLNVYRHLRRNCRLYFNVAFRRVYMTAMVNGD